ncbi:uncharacterized protein LOC143290293 [Babylonia areolata]|uniref:uncharacterized protein LOC143290293 n=1 Tax=Babylonia areolata TaxID=304850 RepID=UPI003FD1B954
MKIAVHSRATCCKDSIVLEAKDLAGNQRQCPFLQEEIHHPVPSPTSLTSTTPSTTPPRLPVSSARQSDSLVSTTVGNPGHHSSSYETTVVSVTTGQSRTTVTVGTNGTSALTLLNDTFAISDAVTHARGSSKPQADYSILKKASIILGSIGGFAGLCIGLLCFLLFCRHRRMLQRHNSCDSQSSCDTDCHHDHSSSSNNNFYHHHSSSSNNNFYHHHSSSSNNCYHHHNSSSSSCHHHYNSSNNSHHHHPSNGHQHRSWNDDNGQRHLSSNSRHHHGNESRHHRSNNGHIHRHSSYVVSTASRRSNDGSGWIVPDVLPEGAAVTEHSTSL